MPSILNFFSGKTRGNSVTGRIQQVKQPRGGYIKPSLLSTIQLGEGIEELNAEENVHPTLVGLAVDYLTRFTTGTEIGKSFAISLLGAKMVHKKKDATQLVKSIEGLDDTSIKNAIKLSGFDACYRAGVVAYDPAKVEPDECTVENIRKMVKRAQTFLKQYGPKVLDGFTFEGGYTDIVSSGDGDFTTGDTIWDFKVSKAPPKKEHTLQLLMYWRMGVHSRKPEFDTIKYLGIYNPRLNRVYRIAVADIPQSVIDEVDYTVIGYKGKT